MTVTLLLARMMATLKRFIVKEEEEKVARCELASCRQLIWLNLYLFTLLPLVES